MKLSTYLLSILLLSLAWPMAELSSAPSRFTNQQMDSSDEEMSSIARQSDEEENAEHEEKLSSYNPTPARVVKPSSQKPGESETGQETEQAQMAAVDKEQKEDSAMETEQQNAQASEPGQQVEEKAPKKKITITDALMKESWEEDEETIGGESIEWVGRDRRIKRVKESESTINLKTMKPSGKLIITDQYHRTPTELLGITTVRKYGARPEESKWLYSGSKFNCELRHPIPGFGFAVMKQGIQEPLQFMVETSGINGGSGRARIQSHPPEWRRFTHPKDLGVVDVKPEKKVLFTLTNEWAKRLTLELKDGMVPTISFWDDDTGGEDVVLTVSSFNFQKHLKDFSKCREELLPYTFNDVQKRTVYFGYDKYKLSDKQRERLNRLIEYVKLDEEVKKVDIIGFSDSVGFARYNQTLARRRANAVKKYMLSRGLPAKKLVVKSRGEKGKKHSNRTEAGRQKNRRVEVTLVK